MYLDSVTDSENPACVPSCKLTTGAAKTILSSTKVCAIECPETNVGVLF